MNDDQQLLSRLYQACAPKAPASVDQYVDCAAARGSGALTQELLNHLARAQDYRCFLFSGHVGCGKSSELEALRRALASPDGQRDGACYFPVFLDVSDYLDDFDVSVVDILLAIVSELASALRIELGIELKDGYFSDRLNELKSLLLSDVELRDGDLTLGIAKLKVQRLKQNDVARQQVREALLPRMSTMLDEINHVFDEARQRLAELAVKRGLPPWRDIVLILDNLEKIRKLSDEAEGTASHRNLFIDRNSQLTGLKTHVIYTEPLRLVRSADGPQLNSRYDHVFVLPMVKVCERVSRRPYLPGMAALRELLQKRVGERPLDEVIAPEALDFLLTYSGGNVRHLIGLIQQACADATFIPIPLPVARRAVRGLVSTYSTAIPEAHWARLARLDLSIDQRIPNGEPDYLTMLENLSVLEYLNGGGEADPFVESMPWYAAHPIVRELAPFKDERGRQQQLAAATSTSQ